MEYIYAALLLHEAGKEVSEENIKKVVESAGIEPDEGRIRALIKALEGVNIDEVLESASAVPVSAPAQTTEPQQAAAEEKKEEKKEGKKEEDATAGLASLFG